MNPISEAVKAALDGRSYISLEIELPNAIPFRSAVSHVLITTGDREWRIGVGYRSEPSGNPADAACALRLIADALAPDSEKRLLEIAANIAIDHSLRFTAWDHLGGIAFWLLAQPINRTLCLEKLNHALEKIPATKGFANYRYWLHQAREELEQAETAEGD